MSETALSSQAPEDDTALYAGADDTPPEARIRQLLVRQFATTTAFMGAAPNDYPHLAADTAMRIMGPILAEVATEARRDFKVAVRKAADARLAERLAVIEGAARASERAACVAQLRGGPHHLAAMALEAAGPAAAAARDTVVRTSGR